MKKLIIENTKIIAIATILSLAVGVASAWTAPTQVAPNGNIETPLNVSANGQDKKGNLIIEGLNALNVPLTNGLAILNGNLLVNSGNVGIGVANPASKLDVNGNINVNGDINVTGNISGILNGVDVRGKIKLYSDYCNNGALTTASACSWMSSGHTQTHNNTFIGYFVLAN